MDSPHLLNRVLGRAARAPALTVPRNVTRRFAVPIAQGATRELPRGLGRMVLHCRAGALWITHDGDPRDVILDANQSHLVDRDQRMTVHGLRAGGLEVELIGT